MALCADRRAAVGRLQRGDMEDFKELAKRWKELAAKKDVSAKDYEAAGINTLANADRLAAMLLTACAHQLEMTIAENDI